MNLHKLIVLILIITFASCSTQDPTFEERYPMPWTSPEGNTLLQISKALLKNNISGCGEYHYRKSTADRGEYLIACSSDG